MSTDNEETIPDDLSGQEFIMMSEDDTQVWLRTHGGFEPLREYGPFTLPKDVAVAVLSLLQGLAKAAETNAVFVSDPDDEP